MMGKTGWFGWVSAPSYWLNKLVDKMNKKIIILFILLVATGCNITSLNRTDNYVYITHQTYYDWQVWKVAIDGTTENKMIYQLPSSLSERNLSTNFCSLLPNICVFSVALGADSV